MPDMTPEQEAKFFETGELPPELAVDVSTPVSAPPPDVAAPNLTPIVPAPTPDPAAQPQQPDAATLLQRQLIEAEARRAATEQQLADLVAQLQAMQEAGAASEVPDPTTDPLGHMQHQIASVSNSIQNLQSDLHNQQVQAAQAAQLQQFIVQVREQRDAFLKTTPDFMDAYKHIREVRLNDLRDAGVPDHMLPAALLQDEMTIAQTSLAVGRNPAAALYDMAKRHGYTPRAGTPAPVTSGTNPVLAAAQAKLAQVQAGQAAATNVPRGTPEVTYTLESLKDASDTDIDKIVQSNDLWNKVAGGRPSGKDIF